MDRLGVHASPGVPPIEGTRVLFVCEGNVCRSPAAELVFRHLLPLSGLSVRSAGVRASVGEEMSTTMARLLSARGVPLSSTTARQFTASMAREADLVVTMTALQRRHVVLLDPSLLRRTWTLLSLAASLADTPPAGPEEPRSLRALSERAAAHRHVPTDDVPDPYGRGRRTYARVLDMIVPAVATVAEAAHKELLQSRLIRVN